ncbi:hypothetical protein G1H11_09435 [Phytoactinopolyspora alkaliphila]|uniref:(2Fe-2S) ferredoxin domain-containing protein n=1 Tax=Phytoactinopolyspora alkaliphila TaxID=1783498 RepID=A0A6N9YKR8_9ACTN|nr:(2Fe-2S) ferredoxin domain-containing protein [Phytoactinopolyspora alkaliphila]NED95535.1 hypothetical protein [Phytoactinopolyspora alkaliphila]
MTRQIVLVGRALGAPAAERALSRLAVRLRERTGDIVRSALLDHGEESLHDALDECHADGATEVLVLPVQVPRDRYLETWVGKAAAHWTERRGDERAQRSTRGTSIAREASEKPSATNRPERRGDERAQRSTRGTSIAREASEKPSATNRPQRRGDERAQRSTRGTSIAREASEKPSATNRPERRCVSFLPEVRIGVGVSETEPMLDALVAAMTTPSQPVTDSPASFRSPNWSTIGGHRHHVLICRGPRCSAHGSALVAQALAAKLQAGPVSYEEVLVTNTGCLVPCNLGPIVVVQPDDVWYTSVDSGGVDRIVDEHLHRGVVVRELRTTRGTTSSGALDPSPAISYTTPEDI